MLDTLIRNGTVIDGSGDSGFPADVLLKDGRIHTVAPDLEVSAAQVVDATGLCIAPGFIDAHTHDDRLMLSAPDMTPKVSQGVTTVVGGNCGVSLSPLKGVDPPEPLNLLGDRDWFRFDSVREYRQELETAGMATNCAMLVGHTLSLIHI